MRVFSDNALPAMQIACYDSICNVSPLEKYDIGTCVDVAPFDFVVGNPPWLAWDKQPHHYREQTAPLISYYEARGVLHRVDATASKDSVLVYLETLKAEG